MKTTHQPGDTVYLENGQQAIYVAPDGDGHIVRPTCIGYHGDEDYEYEGSPVAQRHVFTSPPVEKWHEEVKLLADKAAAEEAQIKALKKEARDLESSHKQRLVELKKYDALKFVEEYLNGEIKFLVQGTERDHEKLAIIDVTGPEMIAATESNYRKELRLLSLFGDKARSPFWNLSQYSEGSGTQTRVIPCRTIEEARAIVEPTVAAKWLSAKENNAMHVAPHILKSAKRCGVAVPEGLEEAAKAYSISALQRDVEQHRASLTAKETQLAAALAAAK